LLDFKFTSFTLLAGYNPATDTIYSYENATMRSVTQQWVMKSYSQPETQGGLFKRKHRFNLRLRNGSTLRFNADSEADKQTWIATFKADDTIDDEESANETAQGYMWSKRGGDWEQFYFVYDQERDVISQYSDHNKNAVGTEMAIDKYADVQKSQMGAKRKYRFDVAIKGVPADNGGVVQFSADNQDDKDAWLAVFEGDDTINKVNEL
jgi:hypothetical protein